MRNGTVTKADGTVVPAYDNRELPQTDAQYKAARVQGKLRDNDQDTSAVFSGIVGGAVVTLNIADVVSWQQFAANAWNFTLAGGASGRTYDQSFPGKVQA